MKMFRSAALIEEVRKKRSLWDSAYNHSEKGLRAQQWLEVAENLFPNLNSMKAFEKKEKVQAVKRKWKNIRDYYQKTNKNGTGKKYVYSHLIEFLAEDSAVRNSTSSIKSDKVNIPSTSFQKTEFVEFQNEENTQNESICESEDNIPIQEFELDEQYSESDSKVPPPPARLKTEQNCWEIGSEPYEDDEDDGCSFQEPPLKTERQGGNNECDDADRCFLLSLLPEMKNMNGLQKIGFKISVLNEISRIMREQQSLTLIKEELIS